MKIEPCKKAKMCQFPFLLFIYLLLLLLLLFFFFLGGGGSKLSIMIATSKKNRIEHPPPIPQKTRMNYVKPKHAMIYSGEMGGVNEKFLSIILSKKQHFTTWKRERTF